MNTTLDSQNLNAWLIDLDHPNSSVRETAKQHLRRYGNLIKSQLLEIIERQKGYQSLEAAQLYWEFNGDKGKEIFLGFLSSKHPLLSHYALDQLHHFPEETQRRTLIKNLPYAQPTLQLRIIERLTEMNDKHLVPTLIAVLRASKSVTVRHMTMHALAQIGDPRAIVFIAAFVDHPHEQLRQGAVEALSQFPTSPTPSFHQGI